MTRLFFALSATLVLGVLSSCALVVSFEDYRTKTWTVQGTVSGLGDETIVLRLDGHRLEVGDGPFTSPRLADGTTYVLGIEAQPYGRLCSIAGGEGTIAAANVTGVEVRCATSYAVHGIATGLDGGGAVLSLTARAPSGSVAASYVPIGEGPFSFRLPDHTGYALGVVGVPTGYGCTVAHGEGTIAGADVNDVLVSCGQAPPELGSLAVRRCSPEAVDAGAPCDGELLPLVPAFAPETLAYALTTFVNCGRYALCVTVETGARFPGSSTVVNGVPAADGKASIVVNAARPTIDVDVTAPDGLTHRHYAIAIRLYY